MMRHGVLQRAVGACRGLPFRWSSAKHPARRVERRRDPSRPLVPWLLSLGLVVWLTAAVVYEPLGMWVLCGRDGVDALNGVGAVQVVRLLFVGATVVGAGCFAAFWRMRSLPCLLCAGCALSLACTCACVLNIASIQGLPDSQRAGTFLFTLEEDPRQGLSGSHATASTQVGGKTLRVRLYLQDGQRLSFGQVIQAKAHLKPPSPNGLASCLRSGCALTASIDDWSEASSGGPLQVVAQVRRELLEAYGGLPVGSAPWQEEGALVAKAVLFGQRTELLESDVYQDVKAAGLAHLVAVSGAHLAIVAGFVAAFAKMAGLRRRASFVLQAFFLCVYVVLVGLPVSCLRAATMSFIALAAGMALRRASALSALGLTIVAFVSLDPGVAVSASFQLSCLATLGIVAFMPLFSRWVSQGRMLKMPEWVRDPLAMTLAATLVTLPISTALFSQLSLVSPLSNVVATPMLAVVCATGMASALLAPIAPLSGALTWCTVAVSGVLCQVVGLLADLPCACLPVDVQLLEALVATSLACAALWVAWPSARALNGAATCALALVAALGVASASFVDPRPHVTMLDVGQGDAILIGSRGQNVLVDTGNQDAKLLAALARNHVSRLDAVVVTHPDDDHCGSLSALDGVVPVGVVILAHGMDEVNEGKCQDLVRLADSVAQEGTAFVRKGSRMRVGDFACEVVAPDSLEHEGGNEDSICLLARADADGDGKTDATALLVGDAESEVLDELLEEGLVGCVDLYKVGHHGSRKAVTKESAQELQPKVSLVSVGANNRYGHPVAETLDALQEAGSCIVRTDRNGDVACRIGADGIEVQTQRGQVWRGMEADVNARSQPRTS